MSNLSPIHKREVADKFLMWLKETYTQDWSNTYSVLVRASDALNEGIFNLWKGYDLLRIMGRIKLKSPNGKKGAYVLDFTPLALPISPDVAICSAKTCPILKQLNGIFKGRS